VEPTLQLQLASAPALIRIFAELEIYPVRHARGGGQGSGGGCRRAEHGPQLGFHVSQRELKGLVLHDLPRVVCETRTSYHRSPVPEVEGLYPPVDPHS
jgi:hypothetical protein